MSCVAFRFLCFCRNNVLPNVDSLLIIEHDRNKKLDVTRAIVLTSPSTLKSGQRNNSVQEEPSLERCIDGNIIFTVLVIHI